MRNCILIVAHGLRKDSARLQPWRYVLELAKWHARNSGQQVVLLTDGSEEYASEQWPDGLTVLSTNALSPRRQTSLRQLVADLDPLLTIWSVSPRSVAYYGVLRAMRCRRIALVTCPLYSFSQLYKAVRCGVPFQELGSLIKQSLIPRRVFASFLNSRFFDEVLVQSESNSSLLGSAGVTKSKIRLVRVGIDASDLKSTKPEFNNSPTPTFIYFGALRAIRGFNALLSAFADARSKGLEARLLVLARGSDSKAVATLQETLKRLEISDRVEVIGGWLTKQEILRHLDGSDAVVLPFVIVPSDVPIAILESMARGRPVIGTEIDGIPELIHGRGLIVNPFSPESLTTALSRMADYETRRKLGYEAWTYMRTYPTWDQVGALAFGEAHAKS